MNGELTTGSRTAEIRKAFYAMRNGLIVDTLRRGGLKYKYIFGLQLPQIKEIATRLSPDSPEERAILARQLWNDTDCREARLTACHIMPPEHMAPGEAIVWAEGVLSREEADILAFRLLRYVADAEAIAERLETSESSLSLYTASAIRRFI